MDGFMYVDQSKNGEPVDREGSTFQIKAVLPSRLIKPGTEVQVELMDSQGRPKSVKAFVNGDNAITAEIEAVSTGNFDPNNIVMIRVNAPLAKQAADVTVWQKILLPVLLIMGWVYMVRKKIEKLKIK